MIRTDLKDKMEKVVDVIMENLPNDHNRITICSIVSAQFLNYYIEKGMILISEKELYVDLVINYFNRKHYEDFFPLTLMKNTMTSIMMNEKGYEYENHIFPISKLIKNK